MGELGFSKEDNVLMRFLCPLMALFQPPSNLAISGSLLRIASMCEAVESELMSETLG